MHCENTQTLAKRTHKHRFLHTNTDRLCCLDGHKAVIPFLPTDIAKGSVVRDVLGDVGDFVDRMVVLKNLKEGSTQEVLLSSRHLWNSFRNSKRGTAHWGKPGELNSFKGFCSLISALPMRQCKVESRPAVGIPTSLLQDLERNFCVTSKKNNKWRLLHYCSTLLSCMWRKCTMNLKPNAIESQQQQVGGQLCLCFVSSCLLADRIF